MSCVAEAPRVERAYQEFAGKIAVYGVVSGPDSAVDEKAVRGVIWDKKLNYPQLRDRDSALSHHFNVQSTPTIVIMGADGKILYSGHSLPEDLSPFLRG